jgi:type I restriction enzyme, S subunit
MSLPRYSRYKDSGVTWLAQVPEHWRVGRIHSFAKRESGHTPSRQHPEYWENCTIPWFTLADVWQIRSGNVKYVYDTQEYISDLGLANSSARLLPANTVILSRTASVGYSAIMGREMATTQDFVNWICSPQLAPEFLFYSLRGMESEFTRLMMGSTHQTIYMPDIAKLSMALPTTEEQSAIIAFLDSETGKIDALIAEQEKLRVLLAEKRQATISHAVTHGLKPDVLRKDSGVVWLGEVPAHWIISPLSRISVDRCDGPFGSGIKSEHYTDEGALVIRLQNIRSGLFNMGEPVFLDEDYFLTELRGHEVLPGDVLVAGLGDDNNLLGRACVAPDGLGKALVKADCFRFRLDTDRVLPEFVALQLSAGAAFDAGTLSTGTTRSRIPLSTMSSRKVAFPAKEEQMAIVEFVHIEIEKLGRLRADVERSIELLKARRSALISAAVTGKIDVRNAVPQELAECAT